MKTQSKKNELDLLIEKFKIDLYINSYKDLIVNSRIDSIVTNEEIESYYNANIDNFALNETLLKYRYLKVPSDNININRISFLKKELIKPTKIYVKEVLELTKKLKINGMAHITGGGLEENLSRINSNYTMIVDRDKCKLKGIFLEIMKLGNITRNEMYKVFNCGIGFCFILDREDVEKAKKINSKLFEIGYVSKTEKKFIFKN